MQIENERHNVEVVYALPNEQVVFSVMINSETTAEEAIKRSGVLSLYPEIDLSVNNIGIFGRQIKLGSTLKGGDRIEIYRPLLADPKEIRRRRAAS